MPPPPADVLRLFIADETSALARGEQGEFYPCNHHVLIPLVARAPKLLPEESERIDLYFHLMRLNVCPALKSEQEFALLRLAYERIKPLFALGYPRCSLARQRGQILFGADDRGELADEPPETLELYTKHMLFWRYADSFWHMPGMLSKRQKFLDIARDKSLVSRVEKVLVQMRLGADLPSLWFWALVFLVLQDQEFGFHLAKKVQQGDMLSAANHVDLLTYFVRYLRAAGRVDLLAAAEAQLQLLPPGNGIRTV